MNLKVFIMTGMCILGCTRICAQGTGTNDTLSRHPLTHELGIGFRPVLEPLFTELSETLVGSKIKVFGPHGEAAVGCLVGFDTTWYYPRDWSYSQTATGQLGTARKLSSIRRQLLVLENRHTKTLAD